MSEHKNTTKKVIRVNHGKVFGPDDWWTFYCPRCNAQVTRAMTEDRLCKCGCKINWDE